MDVTVVLLLLLHSFRGTELLVPSEQTTNSSLAKDNEDWEYALMESSNETEGFPSFQENITPHNTTNATMNNTETGLDMTGSNDTWTSIEDMNDDNITLDNPNTHDTDLNVTDAKDINTNNTNTSGEGSGSTDGDPGEASPSPGTNITQSDNPEDINTFTTIATTNGINGTTTIATTTTTTTTTNGTTTTSTSTSTNDSTILKGLDDRIDTESNRAVDSTGSNTRNNNSTAWAIVIGTALAVGAVSLIVYILKKRRVHRDFNHRKLAEDLPPGPVLRLDSYENLGMGTLSFDNPVLQGDNIYMDHMGGTRNQH